LLVIDEVEVIDVIHGYRFAAEATKPVGSRFFLCLEAYLR
jgi:hypothetical protein